MHPPIGIIGSGAVGQALAVGFHTHGHEVMIGTNTPSKQDALRSSLGSGVHVGSFTDAAQFGRIVVLAVKGSSAVAALEAAGVEHVKNKTVLDTTNPIAERPPVNGVLQYSTSVGESLMEALQACAPDARFVKAFSCIGSAHMVNPDFGGHIPTMFICGNSTDAKAEASEILHRFGFDVEDMGSVEAARAIEPLAILWCIPGFLHNQWSHAFKLLRK